MRTLHNLVAAGSACPSGHLGDRGSKLRVLLSGYRLGGVTTLCIGLANGVRLGLGP